MRIDLLLCRLRFAKSRSIAQRRILEAHIRCNGKRVTRQDFAIAAGDVLTMPQGKGVSLIEILALPTRRGPPAEAQACYRVLDAGRSIAIAGATPRQPAGENEGNSQP